MKDLFSENSENYRNFRPNYAPEVFDFIYSKIEKFENAWDVGTGNGQVAINLAPKFNNVFATDISENQLINAEKIKNIFYSQQPAEKTNFPDDFFELIIVGQAIHWFDFEKFYQEVKRTAKSQGLFVALGYGRILAEEKINNIIDELYYEILGNYWDAERKYIDENYKTIPFPFVEIASPQFENFYEWNTAQLLGYLSTWSALKNYSKENTENPLVLIQEKLESVIDENKTFQVRFPILLRIGRL